MEVFLALGFALERGTDGGCGLDEVGTGDIGCHARAAVASIDELDCSDGGGEAQGGELEEPTGFLHLHLFQAKPIGLECPEGLLDTPAQAIKPDDFTSAIGILRRQRREQTPMERRGSRWRADLFDLDQCQGDGLGICRIGTVLGALDLDRAGFEPHDGSSTFVARPP